MARFVVDACVALKWFVAETDSNDALRLLAPGNDLLAPNYVLVELANALRTSSALGRISTALAGQALSDASSFFAKLIDDGPLIASAFDVAVRLGHPVYDCLYLVAARAEACPMITSDAKFAAKLVGTPFEKDVVLLANW